MLTFEHDYWREHPAGILAGVDEAGRGPLAGPVHAGAVAIGRAAVDALQAGPLAALTDSKRLTASSRERFFAFLEAHEAIRIGIGLASVEEIDRLNILNATHLAMRRAVLALGAPLPDYLLVDGLPVRGLPAPSRAIIGGDGLSLLIAAASVAAKVVRDRHMRELDARHPGYGLAANKGYGTRQHLLALERLGVSPAHRRSFTPVAERLQEPLFPREARS